MNILLTIFLAVLFAEVVGYFLHILLHSNKVEFLSRNHMMHHLREYGPQNGLRPSDTYKKSISGRASVVGVGMEWMGPIFILMAVMFSLFYAWGIPLLYQIVFTLSALSWGYFLFGYMHDSMHIKNFWMERAPILGRWYKEIRRLHDIHHLNIADDGRMPTNFGICFFGFDRLFGTRLPTHVKFNHKGYEQALKRYAYIFK
jgi:sterol desaturase/sphingolipid hydroxylase (fatty acid hydroxylase superfamily)